MSWSGRALIWTCPADPTVGSRVELVASPLAVNYRGEAVLPAIVISLNHSCDEGLDRSSQLDLDGSIADGNRLPAARVQYVHTQRLRGAPLRLRFGHSHRHLLGPPARTSSIVASTLPEVGLKARLVPAEGALLCASAGLGRPSLPEGRATSS